MTTPESPTETARPSQQVEPDPQARPADPSTTATGPSARQTESAIPGDERSAAGADAGRHAEAENPSSSQAQHADTDASVTRTESAIADTRSPTGTADADRSATQSSPERSLFADDQLTGLRARWDNVQAAFVDDPKDCVQKADGLVSDVVEQLTTGFSEARSRLEDQWGRGEEASTEDLRVALKRYREFFERLLAV